MRTVIVRANNVVIVGNVPHSVDCSALDSAIYVIEWNGVRGHIEYVNDSLDSPDSYRANEVVDDFSPYQSLLDAWQYVEDHPPPPSPPTSPSPSALVSASYFASRKRAADLLAESGDVYGAVKFLLNVK